MRQRLKTSVAIIGLTLSLVGCTKEAATPRNTPADSPPQPAQQVESVPRQPADSTSVKVTPAETAKVVPHKKPMKPGSAPKQEMPGISAPPTGSGSEGTLFIVPAGTSIAIRTIESVDSRTDQPGRTYRAWVEAAVDPEGQSVIPKGVEARLVLSRVLSAGDFRGKTELQIVLDQIVLDHIVRQPTILGRRTDTWPGPTNLPMDWSAQRANRDD